METVKVNRESVFFHKLLSAIAYSELKDHEDKLYRVFERIDAITYFDSLFSSFEEKDPVAKLEVIDSQRIEDKTFVMVRTESFKLYWLDVDLAVKDSLEKWENE